MGLFGSGLKNSPPCRFLIFNFWLSKNLKFLNHQKLIIRNRQGGEFFKPDSKRPTKKIKQLLQESDLPPWERDFLPLIFVDDDLALVPNFGIDQKYKTGPQMTGLEVNLT